MTFIQYRKQISSIKFFEHRLCHLTQFLCRNPPLTVGDTFQASYLQALTLLQNFDKGGCLRKGIMGSGIEPYNSSCHGLHLQLLTLQELLVHCCDFQLTTSSWLDMLSHFNHLVRIEIQANHGIVTLWMLKLLLNAEAIALLIKLSYTIALWITYTITEDNSLVF